ncbi:MAG: hypothetical protein UU72_C0001G0004 [candidate division WWE3 bacterium GW2011_GWB1_41_6]|uniref:Uncharacterized protein n=1 Tax=candidate division WWE3 bacterium GW2011_GWB1_41_6 TaxID=1619112 RepID=A0A0G0WXP0_UNCKA|nr:MAG: hypothetical protein UU72_C0001G0004 [candidate division WWE3 bacterium GW2011_GWB1_41_6]
MEVQIIREGKPIGTGEFDPESNRLVITSDTCPVGVGQKILLLQGTRSAANRTAWVFKVVSLRAGGFTLSEAM